ncbi:class I adenylate-forming enzyme family protein [Nonomuraea sp. MG754425]|uniref:class I adenylate-forming enzyme family protein n=1 Tax=Nonomuraea sp. MG754425 TaxID=2570319 RepID=UPI001F1963A2|nr:AMP-binding protein [Nonomuraea sp. MG754425]
MDTRPTPRVVVGKDAADAAPADRSIPDLLRDAAARYGAAEFLRFPGTSLSFQEADARSERLARVLAARGVEPGDRVAVMMGNTPGWPLSWFAILKAGAVAVPVNPRLRAHDLGFVLRDSGARSVLADDEHTGIVRAVASGLDPAPLVRTLADLDAEARRSPAPPLEVRTRSDDVANFQYTSGTTGFPKACVLTHDYWVRTAWLVAREAEVRTDDVVLMAQPFSYMDDQWTAVMCLIAGIPLVVLPRFSASGFWPAVREHRATLTYVLGTMPLLMHKQPPDLSDAVNDMRLVLCSGIAPHLHRAFEERWGVPWREIYGSTESGLDLVAAPGADDTVGTGAMGYPPPGKEVRVAGPDGGTVPDGEVGEIVVRGRPMMTGYWNHPEATAEALADGWYHTGDLGYRDPRGSIHHAGRLKDIVRRGGENISCAEVESVLARHPAVVAAALVPIPDELFGELPKAFVQLRAGHPADTATARDLLDHARERLAPFKIPAFVEFVDGFVMTPSERIRKRALLEPARDQRSGCFDAATDSWK